MNRTQIVPSSAFAQCPTMNMSPSQWSHYDEDGRCNHGRVCGYEDENGGPCILAVDGHPTDRQKNLRHDDGFRWPKSSVWVR